MKKVVFFINSLAGGGAERILSTILFELSKDFEVTLVLIEEKIDYAIPDNINIIYLTNKKINKSGFYKFLNIGIFAYKFSKLCNTLGADFSFSLTTRPNLINSLSKFFGNNSKTIVYEVATPSIQYSQKNILSTIVKIMIRYIYPIGDILIANSFGVSNDLKENFFIEKEIKTIYSPIDIGDIINLSNNEFSLNDQEGLLKFVTVGRLDFGKNHSMMINAFSKISNKNSILYILGEGELLIKLTELVFKLKMKKRIIFLGFDNNPFKYLKQCDVFLFSSHYEGLPTVLIEALACGLPIISTDCLSGPREILTSKYTCKQIKNDIEIGEYGILSPVGNQSLFVKAINTITVNVELRDKYKESALNRSKVFSKEISIEAIKNIIKREDI